MTIVLVKSLSKLLMVVDVNFQAQKNKIAWDSPSLSRNGLISKVSVIYGGSKDRPLEIDLGNFQ